MKFIQLVSALKLIDAQLARAIVTDDKAARHAKLLRESAELLERIESHAPRSAAELREMIGFFSQRSMNQCNFAAGRHDFEIAISLAQRFGNRPFPAQIDATAQEPRREPTGGTADPFDLARQITESRERVAAIDQSYRFLAVSPLHARSLKTSPMALIDRHLCDAIGPQRFERSARDKIDLCFQGVPQDYIYLLDDPIEGQRIIRCTMAPVRDARNRIYCVLIHTRDVTTEARRRDAASQKEPGTT